MANIGTDTHCVCWCSVGAPLVHRWCSVYAPLVFRWCSGAPLGLCSLLVLRRGSVGAPLVLCWCYVGAPLVLCW